ncbi:uncharacterized protein G2W53_014957 [Senna tora]|uniref:Uncharacterized protein n=1 Tax=Senna tora TaxID=362788 RepID=A0A834WUP7_9FABA|nr:uncharacterized protein G2W53_014957 [Senna tora]
MDIEKVKWMFALRASDSGIVELLLLILNIPHARQEPVENPKQSRARDFRHLTPNQTLHLPRRRRLLLLHSPEALLRFLWQDLLQGDDGAERSDALRRRRREICCNETMTPRDLSGGHGSSFDGESFCHR